MQLKLITRKCEFNHYICIITILHEEINSKKLAADTDYDSGYGS